MASYNSSVINDYTSTQNGTEEYYELLKQPVYMIVIYSLAYSIVFVCALIGNLMVMSVVYRNANMHTVTNYFIVNLAVADVLIGIFVLPLTLLSNLYNGWRFGAFMCKVVPYLQGISVCASVNTLAAIAVDRYFAICHSLTIVISRKMCKLIIVCIWIAAVVILIPWAIYYQYEEYRTSLQVVPLCFDQWPSPQAKLAYYIGAIFVCCYTIPLLLIMVCYLLIGIRVWRREAPGEQNNSSEVVHKSKVKVVKMLAVVVILFAFSWLPLYVVALQQMMGGDSDTTSTQRVVRDIIFPIAQWFGSSNSGVNPIIYCFFSRRYRRGFKTIITCCLRRHAEIRLYTESTVVSVGYAEAKYRLYSKRNATSENKPFKISSSQSSL